MPSANLQEKQKASHNLALALIREGFSVENLQNQETGQEYKPASWMGGTAVHINYPGYMVDCFTERVGVGQFFCISFNGEILRQANGYSAMSDNTETSTKAATKKAKDILTAIKRHQALYGDRAKPAPSRHFPKTDASTPPAAAPQDVTEWACPGDIKISRNTARNGIEIRFPDKPDEDTRLWLKKPGRRFRFSKSGGDNRWYRLFTDAHLQEALTYFKAEGYEQKAS